MRLLGLILVAITSCVGCSALPDVTHQPRYHNPFPQLSTVAVLPFYNQSAEATVDTEQFALAYYNELQAIRGFEVMPVGVAKLQMEAIQRSGIVPPTTERFGAGDWQKLAQLMGVDAVVVGSVTEYSPYYPPRLGLSVRWYAANPNFHPIPAGYGLPWGTAEEEYIPSDLVFEAEFALAKEQLKTQTPSYETAVGTGIPAPASEPAKEEAPESGVVPASRDSAASESLADSGQPVRQELPPPSLEVSRSTLSTVPGQPSFPEGWPDPRGFVPPPPCPSRPVGIPQTEPIISHTRLFAGNDTEFTERLANYFYFRDDARFGDWQGYLQRSEDFVRFCCHLHITEMLAARGGAGESRVVWRWPIRRYER